MEAINSTPRLICASFGNTLSLYLELTISFTLITFLWNGTALHLALYTSFYAFSILFLGPIVSSWIDKNPKPKLYLSISSIVCFFLTLLQYVYPDILFYLLIVIIKNCFRLTIDPSNMILLKNSSVNLRKNLSYFQMVAQICKMSSPLLIGFYVIHHDPLNILIFISISYLVSFLSYLIFINELVCQPKVNNNSRTNYFNEYRGIIMDKNISPAFILALISSVFFYLSDSQIILKFYEMGLTKSDYGYAMSLSGLSGVVAGFFISKSVLNANIKNILSCLIFRGLGYFLIPASSYAEDIFHIPREYIMYFAMIVMGGAVSINSILLSTYVQYFSSKDNTAKSTSMISSSIGFAMFSAPPVGSFITYYLGLNACFLATSAGILFMVVIFLIKKKDKVERVLI